MKLDKAVHMELKQREGEVAETPKEKAADVNVNAEVGLASFVGRVVWSCFKVHAKPFLESVQFLI